MKKATFLFIVAGLSLLVLSCQMESNDPYVLKIKSDRLSKDSFYKASPQSPLDDKAKRELVELSYFKPDSNYNLKAHLDLYPVPKSLMMQRTNSPAEEYYNLGHVIFTLQGKEYRLPVYQSAKFEKDTDLMNELFCPFTDATNGNETYKAGRFLDLKRKTGSNDIALDFNMAYNPYCAYNHDYSCPIPPADSHLDIRIEAGEKAYKRGRFSFFK